MATIRQANGGISTGSMRKVPSDIDELNGLAGTDEPEPQGDRRETGIMIGARPTLVAVVIAMLLLVGGLVAYNMRGRTAKAPLEATEEEPDNVEGPASSVSSISANEDAEDDAVPDGVMEAAVADAERETGLAVDGQLAMAGEKENDDGTTTYLLRQEKDGVPAIGRGVRVTVNGNGEVEGTDVDVFDLTDVDAGAKLDDSDVIDAAQGKARSTLAVDSPEFSDYEIGDRYINTYDVKGTAFPAVTVRLYYRSSDGDGNLDVVVNTGTGEAVTASTKMPPSERP